MAELDHTIEAPVDSRLRSALVLVDQVVSSGSNALAILVAAWFLPAADLNIYALLQLTATSLIAFQRSFVSEPSLSLTNERIRADVSGRWVALVLAPASVACFGIGFAVFGSALGGLAAASVVLPCVQDLLRYRSFGLHHVGRALWSDSIWLLLFVAIVAFVPQHTALGLFLAWAMPAGIAAFLLLQRGDVRRNAKLGDVLALGKFQIAEWAIGTATSTVPLFIAEAVVAISSVGAFRLAQTFTGPLNTISSFVSVRFLMGASRMRSLDEAASSAFIKRAGLALVGVAVVYSVIALVALFLLAGTIEEDVRAPLAYAMPLTLLSSVITAPAAAYVAYVKAVGEQRLTIRPRVLTLVANLLATAGGVALALMWGVDPLILPVVVTPIVLVLAWRSTFLRASRRSRPAGTQEQ